MALRKITLKNLNLLVGAQTIELAPYTLLLGPTARESTPVQVLIFMKYCKRLTRCSRLSRWRCYRPRFMNVVNGRDSFKDISIELEAQFLKTISFLGSTRKTGESLCRSHFFDSPHLVTQAMSVTAIGLVIGLSGEGNSDVIIKKFKSGFNGIWLSEIEASAAVSKYNNL